MNMAKLKSEAPDFLPHEEDDKAKGRTYRMKAFFLEKYPHAVTLVEGRCVALCGEPITVQVQGSEYNPPKTLSIPGATQAELKYLFDVEGHPMIEKVGD